MNFESLAIERDGIDMTAGNEIRPGDILSGTHIRMKKKTLVHGRPMNKGEVWDGINAWGDPFCVKCKEAGDYFLLWNPGREKEWFINDKRNFKVNYKILEELENQHFTCEKRATVDSFLVDRPLLVHGKEQNRDPARARQGDVVALDADGDPYRIPKMHYLTHYDILAAPEGFPEGL